VTTSNFPTRKAAAALHIALFRDFVLRVGTLGFSEALVPLTRLNVIASQTTAVFTVKVF
jgi:hypothetical protein